jgi:phage-related protein (TIGR01555 family)
VTGEDGEPAPLVHASRILRIPGATATRDWLLANEGWPPSVLERCTEPLIAYGAVQGLIPNILKDTIRDVIKLAGLNDLAINECESDQRAFNDRLDAMFLAQSLLNKLVLDTQDEYQRQATNLTGIPEMARLIDRRLTAASGLPHTVLLGESPGNALSQSGSSQDRDFSKAVEAYQEDVIRPVLEQFFTLAEPLLGFAVEFAFAPLDVPTLKERAEVFKAVGETVCKLRDSEIITPAEAASPFEGTDVVPNLVLDLAARAGLDQLNKDLLTHGMEVPVLPEPLKEIPDAESQEPEGQPDADPESGAESPESGAAPAGKPKRARKPRGKRG